MATPHTTTKVKQKYRQDAQSVLDQVKAVNAEKKFKRVPCLKGFKEIEIK